MARQWRDAFARETLVRESVRPKDHGTCAWCGGTDARGRVYLYYVETDGGRTYPVAARNPLTGAGQKAFCSESCRKVYCS